MIEEQRETLHMPSMALWFLGGGCPLGASGSPMGKQAEGDRAALPRLATLSAPAGPNSGL